MTLLHGLYAITPDPSPGCEPLRTQVSSAIAGGARVIQYREKTDDHARRRTEASALLDLCRAAKVPLLINDDAALAADIGAQGAHIGQEDASLAHARAVLGDRAIIGVSCYNDFELARAAQDAGATYVAFGSFFASPTKPEAVQADLRLLERAKDELEIPLVAIGGITPENGRALIEAGAHMLAVISAVFAQPNVTAAAHAFSSLFSEDYQT